MVSERHSTARSRELGEELRAARNRAGVTGVEVAADLEWSAAKLSKLETGSRGTAAWEIAALLSRCRVDRATRERIRLLTGEADDGPFVRPHDDRSADDLACLTAHERIAAGVTCYEPFAVPSLLQSEDYARALLRADPSNRMRRQSLLDRVDSVFYLHEAALAVVVGDRRIMHDQMLRLAFPYQRAVLRVVPLSAGGHPALCHPSAVLSFAGGLRPLAHVETDLTSVFTDDSHAARAYQDKHDVLDSLALTAARSRTLFLRQAERYEFRVPERSTRGV